MCSTHEYMPRSLARPLARTHTHFDALSDNLIMQFYASTINIPVTLSISIRCAWCVPSMSIKYLCKKMVVLRKCKIWISFLPQKFINKIWPGTFSTNTHSHSLQYRIYIDERVWQANAERERERERALNIDTRYSWQLLKFEMPS